MDTGHIERERGSFSADHAASTDIAFQAESDDLWIFGFGSLIWKAGMAVTTLKILIVCSVCPPVLCISFAKGL